MAPNINSYIVEKLNDMRVNGVMCDLELVAEDGTCVLVHSAVWVAAFEDPTCLREMGKEYTLSSNQLDIFGVGGSVLKTVVDFIYGNRVKPSDELKGALEKFGMKNWLTYLNLPVSEKYPNETKYGEDKNETKFNLKCGTQDGATSAISVTVKVEKDTESLEKQELRDKELNSSAVDEPGEKNSESKNKEIGFDLSRVKSEPLSPSAEHCSSGYLNFTFLSDTCSEQHEMERTNEQTCFNKTVLKQESCNDTPMPESQIPSASVSTFDTSGNSSQELNTESLETPSQASPVVLNVISLADSQNFKNITQWVKGKGASSSRKTSKAPTSSPRRLQTLLPKQTEALDRQLCEKPSAETIEKPSYSDETTIQNNTSEENMVLNNEAHFKIGSNPSQLSKRTINDHPMGPEPVKLFLNNSNLKSLQVGTPWNIVGKSNMTNMSNINNPSSSMIFPSGTPNMTTTTITSVCSNIGKPVPITSMNPGQNSVSNNSQVVQSSYNSFTVPLGVFPNMQGLGANQTPNLIGNAGSGFIKPIAIGPPVVGSLPGPPVVGPLQLANTLSTGPIIGNFGCQVLQNTSQVSVSQTVPVGVNTASTASINRTTLQNSGGIQLVNNQLGQLVFVNSNITNNQKFSGPSGQHFRFLEQTQSSSVSSSNVLRNSIPGGTTPTRFNNLQNVIGSQLNTGVISGATIMLKGATIASPQTACTTNSRHSVPSSTTTTLSTSNKSPFFDRKTLNTGSNSEEKGISVGKSPKMQDTASATEAEVSKDNAWKNTKHDQEKELETSNVNSTKSDDPFVIDLDNEDDDDLNPLEIPIAKNIIRNIRIKKFPGTLKKTTLQFQDINPVTKSAIYAPIEVVKKNLGTRKNNVAGRKRIVMKRRRESCLKITEGAIDTLQHPDILQHLNTSPKRVTSQNPDISQHPDTSPQPVLVRRRGRPPKTRCGVLYSPPAVPQITSSNADTPKTSNKRKSEPTKDMSSDVMTKFRPIAPKSNVLATFEMGSLQ